MLHLALSFCVVALFSIDFVSRFVKCSYQLEGITRIAYERANGAACNGERHLYIGAMSPSCADYETQLQSAWQISYQTQCILNSYDVFRTWWFYFTIVAALGYTARLYFTRVQPEVPAPIFHGYTLPHGRGFSLLPPSKRE